MAVENYGNKYETTLNGGITNVATSIVVNSTTGVPATPFRAVLTDGTNYEYIQVTANASGTLTVVREVEDASRYPKRAWNSGDQLKHVITATGLMSHFHATTGHDHSGATGQGPKVPITSIASLPIVYVYKSSSQSIANNTQTELTWNTELTDPLGMHFTSNANLTGTWAKTNGSPNLVGTGTLATSELSVGQPIQVPGTANERRVVTQITDNTHITVSANFANTASGQTARWLNEVLVAPYTGRYLVVGVASFAANATGLRYMDIYINDGFAAVDMIGNNIGSDDSTILTGVVPVSLNQYDLVNVYGTQKSGGALNVDTYSYFAMCWLGN